MRPIFILITISTVWCSCQRHEGFAIDTEQSIVNLNTSESTKELYDLKYQHVIIDDDVIRISLPSTWAESERFKYVQGEISRFEHLGEDSIVTVFTVKKLISQNTINLTSDEFFKILTDESNRIARTGEGKLDEMISKGLPKSILENLQVVTLDLNYKIDNKQFGRRVLYYNDSRLRGTFLENKLVTEFHYFTHHKGAKYSFNIFHYRNDGSYASLLGMSDAIAGTIKFVE